MPEAESANIDKDITKENGMPVPIPIAQAQVQETAKSVANKALNGAQTQSLIMVIQQYQSKALTLQQAVNIIALSIGISKDDAKELICETILQSDEADDILEENRAQARDKNGRFAGGSGGGKTRYAPSAQRNKAGIQVSPAKYSKLCGTFSTNFSSLKPSDGQRTIFDSNNKYNVIADNYGGIVICGKSKIR